MAVLLVTDPVHVASVTKSMVAVSVPKLVEEGVIRLQDPAGRHLPEFDTLMKPPGPVTVEHLLRHTSGLPNCHDALLRLRTLPSNELAWEVLRIGRKAPDSTC